MMTPAAKVSRDLLGHEPTRVEWFDRALTHGSRKGEKNYERLEFLGDRVLGLAVANWLFETYPNEAEGVMNRRYAALVARETCAKVGRAIGLPPHIRLSTQAREAHADLSDNVVGDVVEALLGALFVDAGLEACDAFVREKWKPYLGEQVEAPIHPKNALQELSARRRIGTPAYEMLGRFGPHHAPNFKVRVRVGKAHEALGEGTTKQEAETAAAAALMEKLT